MNGLLKKLNLEEILAGVELQTKSENLEDIYSELFEREECSEIVRKLEESILFRISKKADHERLAFYLT